MTTNAGSEFSQSGLGFGAKEEITLSDNVDKSLKQHFRPEFLNRIDEIVTFSPLSKEELRKIIDLLLSDVTEKLAEKRAVLTVSDDAKELILESGYNVRYGARPLKRAIQILLEDPLSQLALQGKITDGTKILAERNGKKIVLKTM